jgi:hypothetical protein
MRSFLNCDRGPDPAGESAPGDIIADAQLAATSTEDSGAAVIAFMGAPFIPPKRIA